MGVKKIYETRRGQAYAARGHGQVVSRTLHAIVERGDWPPDGGYGGFGEADLTAGRPAAAEKADVDAPAPVSRVNIDTIVRDTIAISPDAAAMGFSAMQGISGRGELGFRLEYTAD